MNFGCPGRLGDFRLVMWGTSGQASRLENTLATFLELNRVQLLESWRRRVKALSGARADTTELLNSMPVFLVEMIGKLREGNGADIKPSVIAPEHGSQRFHAGFSLGTVIREYRAFQDCIFDLLRHQGCEPSVEEHQAAVNCVMTAIAEAAQEFERERDKAISSQRDQHLAFVAHELRNPLSSARLAVDLMQKAPDAPRQSSIERAIRNLTRVQTLIDEAILDVRVRSLPTDFSLHRERLNLLEILHEVLADASGDVEAKEIVLAVHAHQDAFVEGDRRLVYSALGNLIRNAVKFTHARSEVIVQVHVLEGRVAVEVEDRCGGLREGKIDELFTPYVQKGGDRSGFGLGLAITKQAIEAHGGTIQVRNLPSKGCVFMFDLPVAP